MRSYIVCSIVMFLYIFIRDRPKTDFTFSAENENGPKMTFHFRPETKTKTATYFRPKTKTNTKLSISSNNMR